MSSIYDKWELLNSETNEKNISSQNFITSAPLKQKIYKIENFLPEELYLKLVSEANNLKWAPNWKSNNKTDLHGHWNFNYIVINDNIDNLADRSSDLISNTPKEIWNWIKENTSDFKDTVLLRCYLNGHTYGTEGYFHNDSDRNNEKTIVVYVVEENWNKDWAGETVFVNENDDIIESVLPKKNRAIVFDSSIQHAARGVTRSFNGLRKTFVMKVREFRSSNFEKLSSFLVKHKAQLHLHTKSSLHDHLVRTYQLLEDKKAPEHVCFAAGLHSVFGTNAYTNGLFSLKQKDIIVSEFGEKVFELAALFSIIDRPNTLENPEGFENGYYHVKMNNGNIVAMDPETFKELTLIEAANLQDQKELNREKYPKIYETYENYGQNV